MPQPEPITLTPLGPGYRSVACPWSGCPWHTHSRTVDRTPVEVWEDLRAHYTKHYEEEHQ